MRKLNSVLILLAAVTSGLAFMTQDFPGWETLTQYTPFVIIAQCTKAPDSHRVINGILDDNPLRIGQLGGVTLSDVKMVATLKAEPGRPSLSSFPEGMAATLKAGTLLTLWSDYRPCQGDQYLLFATYFTDTNCYALDLYRVVPLGHSFDTNLLSGKSLDEQIKFMLHYRLENLKHELQDAEAEKARLEQAVNNATNSPPPAAPTTAP